MATFDPITSSQSIGYVRYNENYRNAARETLFGVPVYFVPPHYSEDQLGEGGPKYMWGYNYNNSPSNYLGNCTWWCCGRLLDVGFTGSVGFTVADAKNWYSNYGGNKSTNVNNLKAGDIIVFDVSGSPSDPGHVMFVEQISGSTVTISESAYSTRSVWSGKSCLVTSYSRSELSYHSSVDIYKNLDSAYTERVIGYLHTNELIPDPPPPPTPSVNVGALYRSVFMKRKRRRQHVTIW